MNGNYFAQKDKTVSSVWVKLKRLRVVDTRLIYFQYHSHTHCLCSCTLHPVTKATPFIIEYWVQKAVRHWPLFHFYRAILFAFSMGKCMYRVHNAHWYHSGCDYAPFLFALSLSHYLLVFLGLRPFVFFCRRRCRCLYTVCQSQNI